MKDNFLDGENREDNTESENELISSNYPQTVMLRKESFLKKIFKGAGIGSLFLGGGILFILFNILQFMVPAIVGLLMIWWAIVEFLHGSIIVGLLVLLIGTPIAIGIASWAFFFVFIFAVFSAIVWGIANLFGTGFSFWNAWDIVWFIFKIIFLGFMTFAGISGLIGSIKAKQVVRFCKESWFYMLIFIFLLWLFFLI